MLNKVIEFNDESDETKQVFVKDMLFATLDTSLRRGKLPNGQTFLLTDTVGFVSKLPTKLIEAFKGTLEEVKYADLLLHVVDASNSDLDIQIKTTYNILKDLKVLDKPIITVFNKMDKIDIPELYYEPEYVEDKIFISARNNDDVERLLKHIEEKLPQQYKYVTLKIPYDKQSIVNYFMNSYQVDNIEYVEDGTLLKFTINHIDLQKYIEYII